MTHTHTLRMNVRHLRRAVSDPGDALLIAERERLETLRSAGSPVELVAVTEATTEHDACLVAEAE